ncbi:hypothetical protein [Nonomuraea soli]|uniref:Integrase n=1 Tax=Nonomuraea soli TaxID=1032476 RepID=A0A7W0CND6_9ACTN|nr:hypothetical protein [Nonomuraea soli]MBA2894379.1 integrase [Nonomuraea soli]
MTRLTSSFRTALRHNLIRRASFNANIQADAGRDVPRPASQVREISEVPRWLGHESITTTVDLYGHLVPEASSRAREALDKAFGSAPSVP